MSSRTPKTYLTLRNTVVCRLGDASKYYFAGLLFSVLASSGPLDMLCVKHELAKLIWRRPAKKHHTQTSSISEDLIQTNKSALRKHIYVKTTCEGVDLKSQDWSTGMSQIVRSMHTVYDMLYRDSSNLSIQHTYPTWHGVWLFLSLETGKGLFSDDGDFLMFAKALPEVRKVHFFLYSPGERPCLPG